MKLQTTLLGKTYVFRDLKQVLAKANEEKTGDKLARLAAETAQERVAAWRSSVKIRRYPMKKTR